MSIYRIYIDEVGNHDMGHVEDPNERFLGLTGVIVEGEYIIKTLRPDMDNLKLSFFRTDPDEAIIFHRKEILKKIGPFKVLRDSDKERRFNSALLEALRKWQYSVATVVIDKKAHRDQYYVWRYHPYHYCLKVLLERFVLFLRNGSHRGDAMVESRSGKEDMQLKDSYKRLYGSETDYIPADIWKSCLTSRELKVKPKSANIAGLQLADLIAYPSRREILHEKGLVKEEKETFSDKICEILNESKYLRNYSTGEIWGYGKKLLP
jgi:hypothetical protein